ncbi:hypothetical protein [Variovorax sp. GB1P17]|uniref:hypothetical protein n=1 Tax=Variovorax sp. GB1P17 TaxID=3443740 RepID=UPI003F46A092
MHTHAARGGGPCTNDAGHSQGLAQERFISAYLFLWRVGAALPKAIAPMLLTLHRADYRLSMKVGITEHMTVDAIHDELVTPRRTTATTRFALAQ